MSCQQNVATIFIILGPKERSPQQVEEAVTGKQKNGNNKRDHSCHPMGRASNGQQ